MPSHEATALCGLSSLHLCSPCQTMVNALGDRNLQCILLLEILTDSVLAWMLGM